MGLSMKEFDVFTAKDLRRAEQVIVLLERNGYTKEHLFEFNRSASNKEYMPGEEHQPRSKRNKKAIGRRGRAPMLLKPGEIEVSGMKCPCGGQVAIEGVCGAKAIKLGKIRTGICMECNKEFKIR
jgi:hypothetical protein